MADIVDEATRSRMMAGIRGRDTRLEVRLQKALHARGLRYRLHAGKLPGRPDIVLPRHRAVIFVHGCFWHRHEGCRYATTPATRPDFWQTRFAENVQRDARVRADLAAGGWRVATVWECVLRKPDDVTKTTEAILDWLDSDACSLDLGETRPV